MFTQNLDSKYWQISKYNMHTFVLFTGLQHGLFVVGLRYIKKVVHSRSQLVHLANEIDIIYIGAVQTEHQPYQVFISVL